MNVNIETTTTFTFRLDGEEAEKLYTELARTHFTQEHCPILHKIYYPLYIRFAKKGKEHEDND